MNYTNGICRLQFTPDRTDFGEWTCEFVIDKENEQAQIGSATIILLNNPPGLLDTIL